MQLQAKHVGALAGLLFGYLFVRFGFIQAVFVLTIGAVGWIIGRVLDGEVDVTSYLRRNDIE
jgi:uncharacterized membrane protein